MDDPHTSAPSTVGGESDTRKLVITVNDRNPDGWEGVVSRILPFIKCTKECNRCWTHRYEPCHFRGRQNPQLSRLNDVRFDHWAKTPISLENSEDAVASVTCGQENAANAAQEVVDQTTRSNIHSPLLNVPIEVFTRIFEFMTGAHELQARTLRITHWSSFAAQRQPTQLIFYTPRTWSDMSVFSVCRTFRELAIEYYGLPTPGTIPFNPKLDTVVIQAERLSLSGVLQPDDDFGYHRNVALQNWWDPNHWLRKGGVYSVNELPGSVGPWSKPMKVSAKFLEQVSSMKLVVDDYTIYQTEEWADIWTLLSQTFTNLKCLKMDICELDSCGGKKGWHKKDYYKAHDLWVFGGLLKASRKDLSIEREDSPTGLFAKLSTIEIEKVASHLGSRIDDSQEEFYEDTLPDGIPTLRHKHEEHRCFRLSKPTIQWDDVSPETDDLVSQDPWDPRNIEWIQEDLSNCEANCGHDTSQSDFIPTRLVNVGEDETAGLRLVMGQSLMDGMSSSAAINYATLSYCWGPAQDAAQQLRTTRTNFDSFCEKIPEDQVTPVIKDAIREENFASRILFFGKSMLHFVCENALYSENYYKETGAGILSGFRRYLDGETFKDRSEMAESHAVNLWRNIVAVSGRQYTYDTDFFPSIAGIARARSDILEDAYMAGMWKRNLHVELLWEMEGPLQSLDPLLEVIYHPSPYIAPSWSWASRFQASFDFIGPYCYIPPESQSEYAGVNAILCYESAPSHVQSEISVVEYSATFAGHNPYGQIKDACLILRGKLAPLPSDVTVVPGLKLGGHFGYLADKLGTVTFDWTVSERTATSNAELVFHANPDEEHAATFAERPPPIGPGETGDEYRARNEPSACFSCAKEAGGRNGWGIVLHPAQIPDAYVRIGVCRLFGGSRALDIFRDEVERDVKII
ncbi:hypothetical protein DL766_000667 [Monosporascus sp. MC13-8B]|nr:hypothetical protein DL766_000667 [Monosporascus sp. MC13-8B]